MNEAVAASAGLRRRSGLLAVLLTLLAPVVGFAYVRRVGLGLAFVLLAPLVLFVAGRLGLPVSVAGFYATLAIAALVLVASLVLAFFLARAVPAGAPPRWYNRWYHYLWLAVLSMVLGNWLFVDWFVAHRGEVFGYETYRVPSENMAPTIRIGDFVAVDTRARSMSTIRRGDIVTYVPRDFPDQTWVARVVGLPNETIDAGATSVAVDGSMLDEPYVLVEPASRPLAGPYMQMTLGADEYYLLGDNRARSDDSRFRGPFPRHALVGKVRHIWFSYAPGDGVDISRIGMLPLPEAP